MVGREEIQTREVIQRVSGLRPFRRAQALSVCAFCRRECRPGGPFIFKLRHVSEKTALRKVCREIRVPPELERRLVEQTREVFRVQLPLNDDLRTRVMENNVGKAGALGRVRLVHNGQKLIIVFSERVELAERRRRRRNFILPVQS